MKISVYELNDLASYVQLNQRSARNGYKIISIIYNGYQSSKALQNMQDSAIESRTKLRLNTEIEKQNNDLVNLKLDGENKRFTLENELNKLKSDFELKVKNEKELFDLELKKLQHETSLKIRDFERECKNTTECEVNKIDENYMNSLKNYLQIDLNKYEIELNKAKNKVDKVYDIVN